MERKDQRDPQRDSRGTESQQQDFRRPDQNERRQFGDTERHGGRQDESGRDIWESEGNRSFERGGGSGYGRQSNTAGQAGQGYYGSRSMGEELGGRSSSGYGRQGQGYSGGQSGQGYYGQSGQGYSDQSGQGYSGTQSGQYFGGGANPSQGFSSTQSSGQAPVGLGYGHQGREFTGGQQRDQYRESFGQYHGRGPKNYLRSDERIRDDVCRRLTEDPEVDASNIDVEVSGREVTLSGTVSSREQRRRAEDCAEHIPGVSHVQNNVRVSRSGGGWFSSGDGESEREITRDESDSLISSEKVEGTAVYGSDRQKIGSIESVMLTKRSGKVAYAVLSFGGFLGMGTEHYPLPWRMLKYDTKLGGYIVNLTKEQLQGAPKYGENETWDWTKPGTSQQIDRYYGRWMGAYTY